MKPNPFTKISLAVTVVLLAAALAIGLNDDRRLSAIRVRLERQTVETEKKREALRLERERMIQAEHAAKAEELKASAVAHLDWFEQFYDPRNPKANPTDADIATICERLAAITSAEAVFILKEYQAGRRMHQLPGHWILRECLFKLAEEHPLAAIDFLQSFEKQWEGLGIMREFGPQVIGDSVISMAKVDPLKAVEWLRSEGAKFEDQIPDGTKQAVLHHIAVKNPSVAFGLINDLDPADKANAVAAIVRVARTDPERNGMLQALRSYLDRLPDEKARQAAHTTGFQALAGTLVKEGPEVAGRWVASQKLAGGELRAFTGGIYTDGEGYGKWIGWMADISSPAETGADIGRLFRSWVHTDHRAAADWLEKTPAGPARETAVRTYAEEIARYHPEVAVEWGLTLPAGELRQQTLRKIHQNWPKARPEDVKAAEAFAEKHGVR
jgi:hypothetical protein